jgi:AGZA family xanthine/uracil permease-like MFS transporter
MLSDALATVAGAVLGTSTTTTYAESSAGVEAGGRTGLSSVVTAFLFLGAIFLSPIFVAIPGFATAPALIYVGFMMFSTVTDIDFRKPLDAVPAYLCIISMTLCYSIADGIAFGVISYVVLHVISGKAREVKPLMYVLTALFVLKYIFL